MKSLQKEQNSTNLLIWPPICRNKRAITPKWFNSEETNFSIGDKKVLVWIPHYNGNSWVYVDSFCDISAKVRDSQTKLYYLANEANEAHIIVLWFSIILLYCSQGVQWSNTILIYTHKCNTYISTKNLHTISKSENIYVSR